MINRVGVLTSGGDAPGMNSCLRAVIRAGINQGLEMYVIYNGFRGIIERKIEKVNRSFVSDIINRGGTKIGTARLVEFVEPKVQDEAVNILREYGIVWPFREQSIMMLPAVILLSVLIPL